MQQLERWHSMTGYSFLQGSMLVQGCQAKMQVRAAVMAHPA
jgi:hypothetical protein